MNVSENLKLLPFMLLNDLFHSLSLLTLSQVYYSLVVIHYFIILIFGFSQFILNSLQKIYLLLSVIPSYYVNFLVRMMVNVNPFTSNSLITH